MDVHNNKTRQLEKYNDIGNSDPNKHLNNEENDELKQLFEKFNVNYSIDTYSFRRIYDLFINNVTFEPNINNIDYIDDLYYLGIYYQYVNKNYDLMKKYYLQAIDKGNFNAMNNLGVYYQYIEINYELMKKYYLQAIEKENIEAMNNLGFYYRSVEINYKLMKKYYLMAIERGNHDSMCQLGWYYSFIKQNYDLMKKYSLMAIDKGNSTAMIYLGYYYQYEEKNDGLAKKYYLMATERGNSTAMIYLGYYYQYVEKNYDLMKKCYLQAIEKNSFSVVSIIDRYYKQNLPNNEDLQNYFNCIIRGHISIKYSKIFNKDKYIEKNGIINLFCLNINNNNLKIEDFEFCLFKIVNYIDCRKSYNSRELRELENIKHFIKYINKLWYCNKNKNKSEFKKCINKIFKKYASQIFMEYLDIYYYEYLKKIFAPGGKGYIKTKKHFELIAKQTM
jgi:TPR repeat protein